MRKELWNIRVEHKNPHVYSFYRRLRSGIDISISAPFYSIIRLRKQSINKSSRKELNTMYYKCSNSSNNINASTEVVAGETVTLYLENDIGIIFTIATAAVATGVYSFDTNGVNASSEFPDLEITRVDNTLVLSNSGTLNIRVGILYF